MTIDRNMRRFLTRRQFAQAVCATVVALAAERAAWPAGRSVRSGRAKYGTTLEEFAYGDVSLAPGPHEKQLEQTHAILMGMNEDSLLRPFRMAAGLPAPGNDMAGWYPVPRFLAETFGQWIS